MDPSRADSARRYVAVVGPADGAAPDGPSSTPRWSAGCSPGRRRSRARRRHHGGRRRRPRAVPAPARRASIGPMSGADRACRWDEHTYLLPTTLGELRNGLLVRAADAVLAVGCSWGTLSEIALARRTGVPLVLLDAWELPGDVGVVVGDPTRASPPSSSCSAVARSRFRRRGRTDPPTVVAAITISGGHDLCTARAGRRDRPHPRRALLGLGTASAAQARPIRTPGRPRWAAATTSPCGRRSATPSTSRPGRAPRGTPWS